MKISKISAAVAAAAMAVSMMAVNASATNWAAAGYADNDPATVNIISHDENSVTFAPTASKAQAKCRISLEDVLENSADITNIYKATWNVTYDGLDAYTNTAIGWLGGGTYCAGPNSASVSLAPSGWNEDGTAIWDSSVTVEDSSSHIVPITPGENGTEFVFIDWSGDADIFTNNVTVTVSDLKFFDKDGNEIAQKAYAGAATAEPAPEADTNTEAAATGNAPVAGVAAVMALAGAAAIASKKRN